MTIQPLTIDDFLPHVGKQFRADCTPAEVDIKLVEASPLTDRQLSARVPFLLVFHTPPERLLMSGIYTMQCAGFGPVQVQIGDMLPPNGSAPGYYYQAVFN